jgi:hypothetical protein
VACPAGKSSYGGTCETCTYGNYCSGAARIQPCTAPPGNYCPRGSTTPDGLPCPPNWGDYQSFRCPGGSAGVETTVGYTDDIAITGPLNLTLNVLYTTNIEVTIIAPGYRIADYGVPQNIYWTVNGINQYNSCNSFADLGRCRFVLPAGFTSKGTIPGTMDIQMHNSIYSSPILTVNVEHNLF